MPIKLELNTTKEKLLGYLEHSKRIITQNAGRATMPEIKRIWNDELAELQILMHEINTAQTDLATTTTKK